MLCVGDNFFTVATAQRRRGALVFSEMMVPMTYFHGLHVAPARKSSTLPMALLLVLGSGVVGTTILLLSSLLMIAAAVVVLVHMQYDIPNIAPFVLSFPLLLHSIAVSVMVGRLNKNNRGAKPGLNLACTFMAVGGAMVNLLASGLLVISFASNFSFTVSTICSRSSTPGRDSVSFGASPCYGGEFRRMVSVAFLYLAAAVLYLVLRTILILNAVKSKDPTVRITIYTRNGPATDFVAFEREADEIRRHLNAVAARPENAHGVGSLPVMPPTSFVTAVKNSPKQILAALKVGFKIAGRLQDLIRGRQNLL